MRTIYRRTRPRYVHIGRIGDVDRSDHSSLPKSFPASGGGLIVRCQRTRNVSRRTAQDYGHFASQVEARKIVIVFLGDTQSISHEDQRRLQFGRKIDSRTEEGIFTEVERLNFAVADQSRARVLFADLPRFELHRLIVSVGPRGLNPRLLQLLDNISLRPPQPRAAGLTAFHIVL